MADNKKYIINHDKEWHNWLILWIYERKLLTGAWLLNALISTTQYPSNTRKKPNIYLTNLLKHERKK